MSAITRRSLDRPWLAFLKHRFFWEFNMARSSPTARMQIFSTPGAANFVVPLDVHVLSLRVWGAGSGGAGGGGGGAGATGGGGSGGLGGNAGMYVVTKMRVTPGETVVVTVGAGGAGGAKGLGSVGTGDGTNGSDGGNGGDTTLVGALQSVVIPGARGVAVLTVSVDSRRGKGGTQAAGGGAPSGDYKTTADMTAIGFQVSGVEGTVVPAGSLGDSFFAEGPSQGSARAGVANAAGGGGSAGVMGAPPYGITTRRTAVVAQPATVNGGICPQFVATGASLGFGLATTVALGGNGGNSTIPGVDGADADGASGGGGGGGGGGGAPALGTGGDGGDGGAGGDALVVLEYASAN